MALPGISLDVILRWRREYAVCPPDAWARARSVMGRSGNRAHVVRYFESWFPHALDGEPGTNADTGWLMYLVWSCTKFLDTHVCMPYTTHGDTGEELLAIRFPEFARDFSMADGVSWIVNSHPMVFVLMASARLFAAAKCRDTAWFYANKAGLQQLGPIMSRVVDLVGVDGLYREDWPILWYLGVDELVLSSGCRVLVKQHWEQRCAFKCVQFRGVLPRGAERVSLYWNQKGHASYRAMGWPGIVALDARMEAVLLCLTRLGVHVTPELFCMVVERGFVVSPCAE